MRAWFAGVALLFADVAVAGEVRAVRFAHGFINAWALVGEQIVLVDAGVPGRSERILRDLRRADLDPDAVSVLVVTHGHADHAGGAKAIAEALDVPIIAGWGDHEVFASGEDRPKIPTGGTGRLIKPFIPERFEPFEVEVWVDDPVDLAPWGVEGQNLAVGGHTLGANVVVLPDGRVVSGDLVRGEFVAQKRPHLHFFHEDVEGAHAAIDALLADGATTFLPGHGKALDAADVAAWRERTRD